MPAAPPTPQRAASVEASVTEHSDEEEETDELEDDIDEHARPPDAIPLPPDSGPQYRYQAPVENASIPKELVNRILDASVPATVRELLSVAQDCRKVVRDAVTTRRIPTTIATPSRAQQLPRAQALVQDKDVSSSLQQTQDEIEQGTITSKPVTDGSSLFAHPGANRPLEIAVTPENDPHLKEISAIKVLLAGVCVATAILDTGSTFICLRRDIWERTGTPLRPDMRIRVTTADSTVVTSLGLISGLEIKIGDLTIAMNAHVVEQAPFEVLLGIPFYAHTCCQTNFDSDGRQILTITDPETFERFAIPTTTRSNANGAFASFTSGFT